MRWPVRSSAAQAPASCDVMLLLEGTFPYVSGGVSSWVNQIIKGFPDLSFGICFIGSRQVDYGDAKYVLPPNVVHLESHYIHDPVPGPNVTKKRASAKALPLMQTLHQQFRAAAARNANAEPLADTLAALAPVLQDGGVLSEDAFLYSQDSWDYLTEQYRTSCTDPSFVDYFWTVRIMHAPIWKLARVASRLMPARCYHTVSTGYAGFLGALLAQQTGRPLLLSEHGIYTKERKIDLFQSEWIRDNRGVFEKDASQVSYFRDLWIRFFEAMGRLCYEASDQIVALYELNRLRQIADGAPAERTCNIANGIDWPRLSQLRGRRPDAIPPVLCLIGRVVPIKDIKTFIRAMRTVVNQLPEAEGWIAGPEDEDPAYARECHSIAAGLGLQDKVRFLGYQKIDDLMPQIGLVVLSSISEALPLVLLEGFAAGVPAVATDVGSCRQLIRGLDAEDRALGAAGEVVGIAEPQALAHAAISLLKDPRRWHAAQAAGVARVERYYTQDLMFSRYRALYQDLTARPARQAALGNASPAIGCPMARQPHSTKD